MLPVAIEFMDRPCIRACEAFAHAGYPDVEALLIVEVEGSEAEIADQLARIVAIAGRHGPEVIRESRSAAESALIWKGRKSAFGAMGQIADYICLDGTIPVSELPFVLRRIGELTAGYGLGVANVFHAGDGNMHPLILYDANKPGELEKAEALGADILRLCVEVGGCLTGEHGVGVEKRDLMEVQYAPADLEAQLRVKDAFDPTLAPEPGQGVPARRPAPAGGPPDGRTGADQRGRARRGGARRRGRGRALAIEGGGTRGLGHAVDGERLSTAGLAGITLYEPGALTLVVRAGTPLAEVEAALAAEGQMLPFEPWDARALTGANGVPTVGGMVAVNASGPRRIAAGRLPRPDARGALRRRHRRGGEERRAGDEERDRARPRAS